MKAREFDRRTPVIAIDFDGVLCSDEYPEIGEPNKEVIQEAKSLQAGGACLVLWTCRTGEDLDRAVQACKEWGLEFDAINENPKFRIDLYGNDCRKIGADEYWDDRAVFIQAPIRGQRNWRNLHGRAVFPMSRKEIRSYIQETLRPTIQELSESETESDQNMAVLFKQNLEIIEQLTAERDEQERESIHYIYRMGYKDATQNAAEWFTGFMEATGMVGDSEAPEEPAATDTPEGGGAA